MREGLRRRLCEPAILHQREMAQNDWFRRTTWTAQDAAEFQARLARSRGERGKAQYLRIQAYHLAEVGKHHDALSLIDQLLKNYVVKSELASTYLQRAESYAALGSVELAIANFRQSLAAQAEYPSVQTNVALDFAWFIALGRHARLYGDVESLLTQYERGGLLFPFQRFQCAVIRSFIASEQGRTDEARAFAERARQAADEQHSGLRYHSKVGLVGDMPIEVAQRLSAIDGGPPH